MEAGSSEAHAKARATRREDAQRSRRTIHRLRRARTGEKLRQSSPLVSEGIQNTHSLKTEVVPLQAALTTRPTRLLGEKRGRQMHVVTPGHSKPPRSGMQGHDTGQTEMPPTAQATSIAAEIHPIEGLTGGATKASLMTSSQGADALATKLPANLPMLLPRIEYPMQEANAAHKHLASPQHAATRVETNQSALAPTTASGIHVGAAQGSASGARTRRAKSSQIRAPLGSGAIVLAAMPGARAAFIVNVTLDPASRGLEARKNAATAGQLRARKGGGRLDSAQGGGKAHDQFSALNGRLRYEARIGPCGKSTKHLNAWKNRSSFSPHQARAYACSSR
jgi:alanyl-tRNA synthetase